MSDDSIDSIEDLDPTDKVYISPATQSTASRRSAHLSEDCEYCLANAIPHEVQAMPNIAGLCDFCVGDPRSVDDGDRDVDWSAQKTLQRAAERVDNGADPLEALAAEQRARSEGIDAQEAD
jgi:hypothetical protein